MQPCLDDSASYHFNLVAFHRCNSNITVSILSTVAVNRFNIVFLCLFQDTTHLLSKTVDQASIINNRNTIQSTYPSSFDTIFMAPSRHRVRNCFDESTK